MALPALVGIRVKETTQTTGTGTYSLDGATFGCRTFVAGIGHTNVGFYCCSDIDVDAGTGNWEVGYGTVTNASPDTLTRDAILASSNDGNPVNWGDGQRDIFSTFPSSGFLLAANNLSDLDSAADGRVSLGLGSAGPRR